MLCYWDIGVTGWYKCLTQTGLVKYGFIKSCKVGKFTDGQLVLSSELKASYSSRGFGVI